MQTSNISSPHSSSRLHDILSAAPAVSGQAISNRYLFILASGSPRRRELLEFLGLSFMVVLPESSSTDFIPSSGKEEGGKAKRTGIDETPLPGESPPNLVQRLSRAKAQAVAALLPSLTLPGSGSQTKRAEKRTAIIIAADTVVVFENKILGKPTSPTEATQMLKSLRQHQYHYVYSGLTVGLWDGDALHRIENQKVKETTPKDSLPTQASPLKLITRLHQSKVWMRPYTDTEIDAYVASGDPLDKAGAYAIQHKTFAPVERLDGCFASVMGLPLGELAAALKEIGLSLDEVGPRCTQYSGSSCCIEMTGNRRG
jgi:septum formation protein